MIIAHCIYYSYITLDSLWFTATAICKQTQLVFARTFLRKLPEYFLTTCCGVHESVGRRPWPSWPLQRQSGPGENRVREWKMCDKQPGMETLEVSEDISVLVMV